jgi:hypothetical protein
MKDETCTAPVRNRADVAPPLVGGVATECDHRNVPVRLDTRPNRARKEADNP